MSRWTCSKLLVVGCSPELSLRQRKMSGQGQHHDACAQQCFQWATSVTLVKSEVCSASQAKSSTEPDTHKCFNQPLGSGHELLCANCWTIILHEGIMQSKLKVQYCCHMLCAASRSPLHDVAAVGNRCTLLLPSYAPLLAGCALAKSFQAGRAATCLLNLTAS